MILPPAILGVLGGGQLGRYFTLSAQQMGYRVWVWDPDPDSPAGRLADRHLCAPFTDPAALDTLAQQAAVVTCEFENIPLATVEALAARVLLRPGASILAVAQDRQAEKRFLEQAGIAIAPWMPLVNLEATQSVQPCWPFPARLKTARLGYDGKGQQRVRDVHALVAAYQSLGSVPCVLEQELDLAHEFSVILARDSQGRCRCFPAAENSHRHGILHLSRVPARLEAELARQAEAITQSIAERLDYCGVLAVEFFVTQAGQLCVNEIAPRPHNSGHYSLDAVSVSQFTQQVRAVCGLPLAPTDLIAPAAMVNLLGDLWPAAQQSPDFTEILAQPRVRLHLYGKREARPGRKMGHITWLCVPGNTDAAQAARQLETLWVSLARQVGYDPGVVS